MATRKPRIEYYWVPHGPTDHRVNWRLVGANGEIMCQSTQGFRDKTDARRSVVAVLMALTFATPMCEVDKYPLMIREVGPGRKPS